MTLRPVGFPSLVQGELLIQMGPGSDRFLEATYLLETGRHQLFRTDQTAANLFSSLGRS